MEGCNLPAVDCVGSENVGTLTYELQVNTCIERDLCVHIVSVGILPMKGARCLPSTVWGSENVGTVTFELYTHVNTERGNIWCTYDECEAKNECKLVFYQ